MNQLLWFYADLERTDCEKNFTSPMSEMTNIPMMNMSSGGGESEKDYCVVKRWRRFSK